jgi:hypothetical protein
MLGKGDQTGAPQLPTGRDYHLLKDGLKRAVVILVGSKRLCALAVTC